MTGAAVVRAIAAPKIQMYGGDMSITGDNNRQLWSKIKGSDNMEYLKFTSVKNLDVKGSIPMNKLEPNKAYSGVFEVKLANDASGWNGNLVTIEVSGTGVLLLSKTYNILNENSLTTATFTTPVNLTGNLNFRLHQKSGDVKKGIIIKRFVVNKV